MAPAFIDNPVINSPYDKPARHFALDETGAPTGAIVEGRRKSQFVVAVAAPRAGSGTGQAELALEEERGGQRLTTNDFIDELRGHVERWRNLPPGQWGVTFATERLLKHWRDPEREQRLFFCQIEAVETVIWLTEVADKRYRERIGTLNAEANPELFRIALKMATGSGKTTVMAMLIAWHAVNKARQPSSRTFADGFLVITPGITIKDRLRVLLPSDPENYYIARDLVPRDMRDDVLKAKVVITNYHAFKRREMTEASKLAREILKGHGKEPATLQTEGQMIHDVCAELMGRRQIVVINDEAHHCYREKAGADSEKLDAEGKAEAKRNAEAARLWISGIEALQRVLKTRAVVYDLSATPFFLRGSGYPEGTLFPWVVSDFSLMDAIECGIVKVPRVPVADAAAAGEMPLYRQLYHHIREDLPKAGRAKQGKKEKGLDPESLPPLLTGALEALYGDYKRRFTAWQEAGLKQPPVFIVVCNNTSTSKLVYDHIAGYEVTEGETTRLKPGALDLFSNVEDGRWRARPRTLLIDSEQLDSGEALTPEFRKMAAPEIEAFKREYRIRYPGADADRLSDEDLLREVMNTVGKPGRLGEQVRCVVSVSMLTEGWDANTVTHILGVRAFGTQLLCEQVVGRGLRRVSYEPEANRLLRPEYADILGIPFTFVAAPEAGAPQPPQPVTRVRALPEREHLEISFPNVLGYRVVLPRERLEPHFSEDSKLVLTPEDAPPKVVNDPIVGEGVTLTLDELKVRRESEVAFRVAGYALRHLFRDEEDNLKPYLFPSLLAITRHWLARYLVCRGGTFPQYLLWQPLARKAAEKIKLACTPVNAGEESLRPILAPYDEIGYSRFVDFPTQRRTLWRTAPDKCHVNFVVWDGDWEAGFAEAIEGMAELRAYVKNHKLGFEVPYVLGGDDRRYRPDFILRVEDGHGPEDLLNLVVEIKGERGEEAAVKAETMTRLWVPAVNNARRFGRWSFFEFRERWDAVEAIRRHLAELKAKNTAKAAAA
jgi:type III restriction enzyme